MIKTNHNIVHKLKKKGWDKHYIGKTHRIFKKSKTDNKLFWKVSFISIIGNIILLTGILPLIIGLPFGLVLIMTLLAGVCIGVFIEILLREMVVSWKHYAVGGVLNIVIVVLYFLLILNITETILNQADIFIMVNPLAVVSTYIVGFILPHIIFWKHKVF